MKRCPQCNRVETDDALAFCRADGAALVSDSGSFSSDAGTAKFGSGAVSSEIKTSILPHTTDSTMNRATAPTTILPAQQPPSTTRELIQPTRRKAVIVLIVLIAAVAAAAIVISGYLYYARNSSTAIESIAVLPFENRSGSPDSDYLSDGLAESLIYRLSQLPNLRVSPTSSVMRYKGKGEDLKTIANELGVDAVMTGRLVQRGDNLTISVELIDVRSNKLLWGEQYERKMSDLLQTQREIAREIVEKLKLKVTGEEKAIAKRYTESNEAYQLYLKGRFYWNKRNAEALKKSIEYFNQAIEKDPNFALAYAGLSDVYGQLPVYSAGSSRENVPKAMAAAKKALEIDETVAEAHTSLGLALFFYEWNLPESNKEYQRAFELNPNYATAHQWYGIWNLASTGRFDEASAELKRAQRIDPLSLIINANLGESYIYARQYDKAIEQLRKTLELDQNFYRAHWTLGLAYELNGSFPEAIAEYQKARALDDDPRALAMLGHAYATSGKRDEALKALDQLKELAKQRYVSPINFVFVYAGLGEKDEAFRWLETSYQERDPQMTRLKVNPLFDPLRSDPRLTELMRRVGLAQ